MMGVGNERDDSHPWMGSLAVRRWCACREAREAKSKAPAIASRNASAITSVRRELSATLQL